MNQSQRAMQWLNDQYKAYVNATGVNPINFCDYQSSPQRESVFGTFVKPHLSRPLTLESAEQFVALGKALTDLKRQISASAVSSPEVGPKLSLFTANQMLTSLNLTLENIKKYQAYATLWNKMTSHNESFFVLHVGSPKLGRASLLWMTSGIALCVFALAISLLIATVLTHGGVLVAIPYFMKAMFSITPLQSTVFSWILAGVSLPIGVIAGKYALKNSTRSDSYNDFVRALSESHDADSYSDLVTELELKHARVTSLRQQQDDNLQKLIARAKNDLGEIGEESISKTQNELELRRLRDLVDDQLREVSTQSDESSWLKRLYWSCVGTNPNEDKGNRLHELRNAIAPMIGPMTKFTASVQRSKVPLQRLPGKLYMIQEDSTIPVLFYLAMEDQWEIVYAILDGMAKGEIKSQVLCHNGKGLFDDASQETLLKCPAAAEAFLKHEQLASSF